MRIVSLAALALASLCACAQFPASRLPSSAKPAAGEAPGGPTWSGSQLYARDGSVVGVAGASEPAGQDGPTAAPRDLAPSEGGRMYILELYQKAIDQRDALEIELRSLQADLERVRQGLAGSEQDNAGLRTEVERLSAENQRLLQENLELAARLTTAQIRRLQVEKMLLETRIDELKATPEPEPAPKSP